MSNKFKNTDLFKASFPWHGWILGGILFLYSLAASFDSLMNLIQGESYYRASGMNEMQVNYFLTIPLWVVIGSTISVWSGLFASATLLFRRAISSKLFLVSVVGNVFFMVYAYTLSSGREAMGVLWLMPIILTLIMLGMMFYSRRLIKLGLLV